MKRDLLFTIVSLLAVLASCRKSGESINPPANPMEQDTIYTSNHQKNLNIVYFVPSDNDTVAGWHKRLSDIFIWGQDYFKTNMQRSGYGNKTYGLMKDAAKGLVKIILIKGKLTKDQYPYSGGSGKVTQEIKDYIAANPGEFSSDHVMVMMPAAKYAADGNPGGVPFYGSGRWAFGIDYPYLNVNYMGRTDLNAEEKRGLGWVGATYHEMAHALNIPHNREKISDRTTPGLGYALMGPDMREFNNGRSFLTDADCAILNVNEVFQINGNMNYYSPVNSRIRKLSFTYDAGSGHIKVAGRFHTDVPVTDVTYYLDPNVNNEGVGVNNDYNAVTWRSKPIVSDSFSSSIPVSELHNRDSWPYELKIELIHENGMISENIYPFKFLNNIPVIIWKEEFDKTGWSIIAQSSQESSFPAANIIDGKFNSYWRSAYTAYQAALPHAFRGDMLTDHTIKGISFRQRIDALKMVKTFEIQFSDQSNGGWLSAGTFTAQPNNEGQYFDFSMPVTKRYFRLVITSNHDGTNDSAIGEIGFY